MLVSNDNAFYAGTKSEDKFTPHAVLLTGARLALGAEADDDIMVSIRRSLSEITIPGQYIGEPYQPDYGDNFAAIVMLHELEPSRALDDVGHVFRFGGWDVAEPSSVTNAELLSAIARNLEGSPDMEVEFEIRGDVTFELTRYVGGDDQAFPDIERGRETRKVRLTGRALVPIAGEEHLTLSGTEARLDDLLDAVFTQMPDPINKLRTPAARTSMRKQLLADASRQSVSVFVAKYLQQLSEAGAAAVQDAIDAVGTDSLGAITREAVRSGSTNALNDAARAAVQNAKKEVGSASFEAVARRSVHTAVQGQMHPDTASQGRDE